MSDLQYCQCGAKIESTSGEVYRSMTVDGDGQIIYAVCVHGVTVIDKLANEIIQKHKDAWEKLAKQ